MARIETITVLSNMLGKRKINKNKGEKNGRIKIGAVRTFGSVV